jgi:hypothetical protein
VAICGNHMGIVEDAAVARNLPPQPGERIQVALDFESRQSSVNNRNVRPQLPMINAKFIHYKRLGVLPHTTKALAMNSSSDGSVVQHG